MTAPRTKPRVLIAADTVAFGRALAAFLGEESYEFTLPRSSREALNRALDGSCDLCLLEDRLPALNGVEVRDELARSPAAPPVVLFSLRGDRQAVVAEAGGAGFLRLPCRVRELRDLVESLTGNETILLVDDSRVIHTIVEDMLGKDYDLAHAFDGNEGYEKALELLPDLIISDIDMPGVDGYEFCQRVKETPETEHIPILMQSSRGSGLDIDRGFDAGANDYITKPINPDELTTRVRQILTREDQTKRETILVVDDSKTTRNFMSQGLVQQGFEVATAPNGQDALAVAIQRKPDLIVTDLEMPIMGGRELTREIRKHEILKDTPVIMLTASGRETDRAKGKHAGVNAYLSKPFPPDKLVVLVEKLMAEQKLLAERGELENRNQFIRDVFGRYMAEDVVKTLLESSDGLRLGGERRYVTIVMSDLRGFSAMSEVLSPEEVVSLLNDYLEAMTNIIVKYRGTIDAFIGDAILTIFGAPIAGDDDAHRAVACALEMQLAMASVNQRNKERGFPAIEMGIGINTGDVVVGNIGSRRRATYSVIGSHVNMAARVESFTVGGQILISKETLDEVADVVRIGRRMTIEPKGAKAPMTICEVTGIGTPYDVELPSDTREPVRLATPLPCRYRKIEQKVTTGSLITGHVSSLTEKTALVVGSEAPGVFSDIKMDVVDPITDAVFDDVYAKVIEKPGAEEAWIHFTSLPEEATEFLSRVLEREEAATEAGR